MDLHYSDETGIKVVSLRFFGIKNFYWVCSSWDGEDGCFIEILGELHSVQSSRCYDQLHVCAFLYSL